MASACSSSISVQKSNATSNNCKDNVCSSGTSCYLQKKKPAHPLAASIRPFVAKRDTNVKQRVRSAKMIKLRTLQSQLNDANFHLMELAQENRALKTLQRRQDKALKNYEGVNADLPRLIQSHEETNRVLTEKNKCLKRTMRDLSEQLKMKDEELIAVKDQLKHLMDLAKDKNLEEREKLRDQLEEMKQLTKDYEQQISILNRKLQLEEKNNKHKLNAEVTKNKRYQRELAVAIHKMENLSENSRERKLSRGRAEQSPYRKSQTNLSIKAPEEKERDIKLEPINRKASSLSNRSSLTSPAEKIKARLSSGRLVSKNTEEVTDLLGKLQMEEEQLKKSLRNGIRNPKLKSTKLETLLASKQREEEKKPNESDIDSQPKNGQIDSQNEEPDQNLEKHESDLEDIVDEHIKKLEESKAKIEQTEKELETLEGLESSLPTEPKLDIILKESDYDLVNEIWSEEFSFRKTQRDRNGNLKSDPIVALEKKRKLLATLKDIDNGKPSEEEEGLSVANPVDTSRKSRLMKELFG